MGDGLGYTRLFPLGSVWQRAEVVDVSPWSKDTLVISKVDQQEKMVSTWLDGGGTCTDGRWSRCERRRYHRTQRLHRLGHTPFRRKEQGL